MSIKSSSIHRTGLGSSLSPGMGASLTEFEVGSESLG
jgi:hypothetical protein